MPDQPDMIAQAGELLRIMQQSTGWISQDHDAGDDRAIVIASAVLAVAAEIRDLRNVLADEADKQTGACAWSRDDNYDYWTAGCGLEWSLDDGDPADNGMTYCPSCGRRITRQDGTA